MNIFTDDDNLSVTVELDGEPLWLDLRGDLGTSLLDKIEAEQVHTAAGQQDPDGRPWARLSPATIRRKGFATVGIQTGRMLRLLSRGDRDYEARRCTWLYPADRGSADFGAALGFHLGGPGRPARRIVGVSRRTRRELQAIIDEDIARED